MFAKSIALLCALAFLISPTPSSAQPVGQRNSVWYFGQNAGLDFRIGTPTPLTDGTITLAGGSASICDEQTGELLFYTDGVNVWNRDHQIMPHGHGLLGDVIASQSALIVPDVCDKDRYYIFTVAGTATTPDSYFNSGVHYSIVDMSLDNGLGDLVSNNRTLRIPTAEKIAATVGSDDQSYWVVTKGKFDDKFYAYHLSKLELDTTPVVTSIGVKENSDPESATGYMQFSPDGKRCGVVIYEQAVELLDFDNATGVFSNCMTLPALGGDEYGICFSPDNTKLYVAGIDSDQIVQFDLSSNNFQHITHTRQVFSSGGFWVGAMQIGKDQRIYVPTLSGSSVPSTKLSVFNNPNAVYPACDYQTNVIDLGGRESRAGLPNFLYQYVEPIGSLASDLIVQLDSAFEATNCSQQTKALVLSNIGCGTFKIDSFRIVGATDTTTQFRVIENVALPLRISSSVPDSLTISFDPTSPGDSVAVIEVFSSETGMVRKLPIRGSRKSNILHERVEFSSGASTQNLSVGGHLKLHLIFHDHLTAVGSPSSIRCRVRLNTDMFRLIKLVAMPGWTATLNTFANGSCDILMTSASPNDIPAETTILTLDLRALVGDSVHSFIQLDSVKFNEGDPTYEKCVVQPVTASGIIEATVSSICGDQTIRASLSKTSLLSEISIYPNPSIAVANGYANITIRYHLSAIESCSYRVIDMGGNKLAEGKLGGAYGDHVETLHVGLSKGSYFVVLEANGSSISTKLEVEDGK